ncbi:MAG: ECF transporter S component [Bifidobacteriaceae bacterium]|jgi:energy-coupling factor transport system substrate-specific component|nr:ECF transporter S component [Bifidobacteriaceae bacterium]
MSETLASSTLRRGPFFGLTLYLIPIGVAINFVGGQLALLLKLPVYLDAIGTILVGAICGPWAGMLTGFLSNAVNAITSPPTFAYVLCSLGFGLLAGLLGKRGWFRSWWKTLISALGFAIIGGIGGACIAIVLFDGLAVGGAGIVVGGLTALGMDTSTANFVAQFPLDLIDKIPSTLIVYLVIKGLPRRILAKVPLGHVYLDPPRPPSPEKA